MEGIQRGVGRCEGNIEGSGSIWSEYRGEAIDLERIQREVGRYGGNTEDSELIWGNTEWRECTGECLATLRLVSRSIDCNLVTGERHQKVVSNYVEIKCERTNFLIDLV